MNHVATSGLPVFPRRKENDPIKTMGYEMVLLCRIELPATDY